MAALRRAFPPQEWDVRTTTIDTQISDDNKLNPAAWLQELTKHYLGAKPIIQSTRHFLRILKQEPTMSIQDWQKAVRLSFQKCNFPVEAEDRLQRDIFVIGLNDKRFRSDVISRETFATLTLARVIAKAQVSRKTWKQNRLLYSTILKRLLTRSPQARSLRLRLLSKLLKPALLLANGVASHLTAVVVNAQQRMLHVLFVVNVAIGNTSAKHQLQNLLRLWILTQSQAHLKRTLLTMKYMRSKVTLKAFLLTQMSALITHQGVLIVLSFK